MARKRFRSRREQRKGVATLHACVGVSGIDPGNPQVTKGAVRKALVVVEAVANGQVTDAVEKQAEEVLKLMQPGPAKIPAPRKDPVKTAPA